MNYGAPYYTDPFRPSKPGSFIQNDPGDPGRENQALKNINKPDKRHTALDALEQDIPCDVNKSRDDYDGQSYWSHFRQ